MDDKELIMALAARLQQEAENLAADVSEAASKTNSEAVRGSLLPVQSSMDRIEAIRGAILALGNG